MKIEEHSGGVFTAQLYRLRDVPARFAFAALVGSNRFWAGLVVALPLTLLLASRVSDVFVPLAAGVPIGICLWLLWMSHEFVSPVLTVDTENRALIKSKPYDTGEYAPIDVDDLDHVSIIRFSHNSVVNFHYTHRFVSKPLSTAISVTETDDFETQLEQLDVEVSVAEFSPRLSSSNSTYLRLVATPIVLVGLLLTIWYLYGLVAFSSGAVVIPLFTMILFGIYGALWRRRLQRTQNGQGSEVD